jgi:hypothetical protein
MSDQILASGKIGRESITMELIESPGKHHDQ